VIKVSDESGVTAAFLETGAGVVSLHSRRDPVAEAARLLEPLGDEAEHLVVIGLGLGYVLDALDRREWPGHVLAFEVVPDLAEAARQREVTRRWLDRRRLSLFVGPDFPGADDAWRLLSRRREPPPTVVHPVLLRARPAEVAAARERAARIWFESHANANARRTQAWPYLRNTLVNAPRLAESPPSGVLDGLFADMPAVLVGAGPSLDRQIAVLREMQDRALVIAADTAARPLLAHGIQPHVIVALDPTDVNARHLLQLPANDSFLVAEGSVDPHALASFDRRVFTCAVADHQPWPWLRALGLRDTRLRAWGSVLTAATDLGMRLGCPQLIFIGADLAFTGDRPYCRRVTFEEDWALAAEGGQSLEQVWADSLRSRPDARERDVHGELARTAPHLIAFRDWIARQAAGAPDRRFVNASRAGILHGPGIHQQDLADALGAARPLPVDPRDRLRDAHARHAAGLRPVVEAALAGLLDASPADEPLRSWLDFVDGAVPPAALSEALRFVVHGRVSPGQAASAGARLVASSGCSRADFTASELTLLESWGGRVPHALVVLPPDPDARVAAVQRAADSLQNDQLVVLRDPDGPDAGTLVRRTLTERAEGNGLWFDDGRFTDWSCRLFAVSRIAPAREQNEPEAEKRGDAHRDVARDVVGRALADLARRRVVDIGCGDGHWIDALREIHGADARGVPVDGIDHIAANSADAALLLHVVDRVGPETAEGLVRAATGCADTVYFASIPPGCGKATPPYARTLAHWARLFAERGFALDDAWRAALEAREGFASSWYELFVVFRRGVPAGTSRLRSRTIDALVDLASRADAGYEHAIRLRVSRLVSEERSRSHASDRTCDLRIETSRILVRTDGGYRVSLSAQEARRAATAGACLLEEGTPLLRMTELVGRVPGAWGVVERDLVFVPVDATHPRFNGRRYTLRLPDGPTQ
jgi:hypothetical protein